MPGLVRKLVIIAAVDGLILQPSGNGPRNGGGGSSSSNSNNNSNGGIPPLRIAYKTQKITSLSQAQANSTWERSPSLEAHGLVGMITLWIFLSLYLTVIRLGLLNIASYSFLISITQREQVAQILGKPIYAVTNVAVIPLSSQADASHAILQAQKNIARRGKAPSDTDAEDILSSEAEAESDTCEEEVTVQTPAATSPINREEPATQSSVAQDVIGNRGRYGRFSLNNWFLRKRWGSMGPILPKPKETEVVDEESKAEDAPQIPVSSISAEPAEPEGTDVMDEALNDAEAQEEEVTPPNRAIDLMPKLLRYTKLIFSSRNFFFAYDYDLTRKYSVQNSRNAQLPSHGLADSLVWKL